MPNTTNFNWTTPADTDLVKDGALAIRTLANGIDTSLVDLKGGTTGQVLAKATNTDLDFSWVAQDDSNAIQNAIIDAKGDLIVGTAADTPARLAVGGTNGHVLTVDSGEASGIKWAAVAGGGMTLINTGGTTLTGASVTIGSIPSTYIDLYLVIQNARPANDVVDFNMRLNSDSNNRYSETAGGSQGPATFANTSWTIATNSDNGASDSLITVRIFDYANATTWKIASNQSIVNDSSTPTSFNAIRYMNSYNQTAAISSITVFPSSGNWTSGTAYLYGVK